MPYQLPQPSMLASVSPQERKTAVQWFRLMLAFIKEAAGEQLKQVPVVGPLMSGGLEVVQQLSDDNASREADAVLERLAAGQQDTTAGVEQLQQDLTGLRPSPTRHAVAGLGRRVPVGGMRP